MLRVLVVEDEETVLMLVQSALDEHGVDCRTATNMAGALALLDETKDFDALFTDIELGEESGLDLADAFRRYCPDAPVLYTTGQAVNDGLKARMVVRSSLLSKPYKISDLMEALNTLFSAT